MLIDRRRRHVRPHPARRQLRPARRVVPVQVQSDRIAGEYAARSVGIPKPALASFWRWRAAERGEGAARVAREGQPWAT
jgi:hypothetical protein